MKTLCSEVEINAYLLMDDGYIRQLYFGLIAFALKSDLYLRVQMPELLSECNEFKRQNVDA